jgi:hypothetical protein
MDADVALYWKVMSSIWKEAQVSIGPFWFAMEHNY